MSEKSNCRFSKSILARVLVAGLLLPMLASCVTYYYPAPEQVEGVYYAADDPGYSGGSVDYVAVSYYPWWSVDYFYLGYGYRSSSWSVGFSYGSPWWPSYGWGWYPYGYASWWYYDPWYVSWWGYPSHYWGPGYGYPGHHHYWHVHNRHHWDRYDYHHGDPGRHGDDWDRYARNDRRGRYGEPSDDEYGRYRSDGASRGRNSGPSADNGHYRATGHGRDEIGSWDGSGRTQRRVSVSPDSGSTDRGMVVANRDGGKWSRSRLEPVGNRTVVGAAPRNEGSVARDRTGDDERVSPVRSTGNRPSDFKASRSRTTPVTEPVGVGQPGSRMTAPARRASPASGSSDNKVSRSRTTPGSAPVAIPVSPGGPGVTGSTGQSRSASTSRAMPASRPPSHSGPTNRSAARAPVSRTAPSTAPSRSAGKSRSQPAPKSRPSKSRNKRDR